MVSTVATRNDKVYIEIIKEDETLFMFVMFLLELYSSYDMHLFHGPDAFPYILSIFIHPLLKKLFLS